MDVFLVYAYATSGWLTLQSVPLLAGPSMIVAMLLDETRPATIIETYFARSLGIALLTIAVLNLFLTGSIPLNADVAEPISISDRDPKAPYAQPTLIITLLYHAISSFYAYTWYVSGGQATFAISVGAHFCLAFVALWCLLFATGQGKISRRTGADKRTAGFPFKNAEASKKHGKGI